MPANADMEISMIKTHSEKLSQRGRKFDLPGWGNVSGSDDEYTFDSISVAPGESAQDVFTQIMDAGIKISDLARVASSLLKNAARPSIDDLAPVRDVVKGLMAAGFSNRNALLQALEVDRLAEVAERYGVTIESVEEK